MTDDKSPTVVFTPAQGVVGVATRAVDALRGTPMLLVMVLLNCAFLLAGSYYIRGQQDNAFKLVDKMFDRCLPEGRAHSDIYPPSPLNGFAQKDSP